MSRPANSRGANKPGPEAQCHRLVLNEPSQEVILRDYVSRRSSDILLSLSAMPSRLSTLTRHNPSLDTFYIDVLSTL